MNINNALFALAASGAGVIESDALHVLVFCSIFDNV